jgi:hypothetical protein
MSQIVELLDDNWLIGTHVHKKGDIVEVDERKAREWIKQGRAVISTKTPMRIPTSPLRSELIEENAENPAPSKAEQQVLHGKHGKH